MRRIYNVLDIPYLGHLQSLVLNNIPWYCLNNSANSSLVDQQQNFSFEHLLYSNTKDSKSDFFSIFYPAILTILHRLDISSYQLLRARLGLTTKDNTKREHTPHIDLEIPHGTVVFYINSSDGPTTLYKEKYNGITPVSLFNISEQIEPIANSALLFDGLQYHSSTKPFNNSFRFILNINFILK